MTVTDASEGVLLDLHMFCENKKGNQKKGRPSVPTVCCDFINKAAGIIRNNFFLYSG